MATHASILTWRIPWTEEPGGLQSVGSQGVGHDESGLAHVRWPQDSSRTAQGDPFLASSGAMWPRRGGRPTCSRPAVQRRSEHSIQEGPNFHH